MSTAMAQPVAAAPVVPTVVPHRFREIAEPLAKMGVPMTPVRAGTKRAFLPDFPTTATTDLKQITEWDATHPNCNGACVARAEAGGVWFWEVDTKDVVPRLEKETGMKLPATFMVRSRPGRGHFYWKQTAASIGMGNISQTYVVGQDWSARVHREYVVAPGSIHPETGLPYSTLNWGTEIVEAPDWLIKWLVSQKIQKTNTPAADAPRNERGKVPQGSIHDWMLTQAGRLRKGGANQEEIETTLLRIVYEQCEGPIDDDKVRQMAKSICIYEPGQDKSIYLNQTPSPGSPAAAQQSKVEPHAETNNITDPSILEEEVKAVIEIPPFDPSVMNGLLRDYVELATVGTTMVPQFAFSAARVMVGAQMTGRGVKFKDTDTDAMLYVAAIAESGGGKGWAWRRVLGAFEQGSKRMGMINGVGCKIMDGIDSGAGLKDFFFTQPENQPIIAYIDEVADLGEKADPKRNPGIVTTLIELAENRSVSRTLAGKKKHTDKAYLGLYMAGQSGEVYMHSLPNRSKLGLFDRLRPEFSVPVEAGETPEIDGEKAATLYLRLQTLLSQISTMEMDEGGKFTLSLFWSTQPAEIKTKVRFKKHILVDAFISAFSRGSATVQEEDVDRAIKIFQREIIIRQIHFSKELPNRMAVFTDKMIELTEKMRRQLNRGARVTLVALGRSDFEKHCGAYKSGEYDLFDRAFQMFSRAKLDRISVDKGNGQKYEKYIPKPNDDGAARGW